MSVDSIPREFQLKSVNMTLVTEKLSLDCPFFLIDDPLTANAHGARLDGENHGLH